MVLSPEYFRIHFLGGLLPRVVPNIPFLCDLFFFPPLGCASSKDLPVPLFDGSQVESAMSLASIYSARGKHEMAEPLLQQVLEWRAAGQVEAGGN